MNVERYHKLRKTLVEAESTNSFNWNVWGGVKNITQPASHCNTQACVAGWAAAMHFQEYDVNKLGRDIDRMGLNNSATKWVDFFAGWLGISKAEASFICLPSVDWIGDEINPCHRFSVTTNGYFDEYKTAIRRLAVVRKRYME